MGGLECHLIKTLSDTRAIIACHEFGKFFTRQEIKDIGYSLGFSFIPVGSFDIYGSDVYGHVEESYYKSFINSLICIGVVLAVDVLIFCLLKHRART